MYHLMISNAIVECFNSIMSKYMLFLSNIYVGISSHIFNFGVPLLKQLMISRKGLFYEFD